MVPAEQGDVQARGAPVTDAYEGEPSWRGDGPASPSLSPRSQDARISATRKRWPHPRHLSQIVARTSVGNSRTLLHCAHTSRTAFMPGPGPGSGRPGGVGVLVPVSQERMEENHMIASPVPK